MRYSILGIAVSFVMVCMPLFSMVANAGDVFPLPEALKPDVNFWKRVYTEISTEQGYIHDAKNLSVVYEKIDLPANVSRKTRQRYVKGIKKKYTTILNSLATGRRNSLSKEEGRVLAMWPKGVSNKTLRSAINQIRFQRGQSDKFRAGLIRSGKWKPYILDTLRDMGLPEEISALPHVESSFNHKAYSKVGAAGIWQFMRSTGQRFMRVDHVVDERMDPLKASVAAARLLDYNFKVTGSWPLAIISYNHGSAGMRRASRLLGTSDIVSILRKYSSRTFKFASRNFYVAFLAAVEIDKNPVKYFGELEYSLPVDYELVKIPAYMPIDRIEEALGISRTALKESNPALRLSIWNGNKHVPKNYELRIDKKYINGRNFANNAIASIDSSVQFQNQKPDRFHRVGRGQTLSVIAARYNVQVSEIVALNGLRNRNSIRAGKVLRLPQKERGRPTTPILVAENRSPDIGPISIPESGNYRVRSGDNIDRIARRYGISSKELQKINNIRNKNRIYPGQTLILAKAPEAKLTLALAEIKERQPVDFIKEKSKLSDEIQVGEKIAPVIDQGEMNNLVSNEVEFPISVAIDVEADNQATDTTENDNAEIVVELVADRDETANIVDISSVADLSSEAEGVQNQPLPTLDIEADNQASDDTTAIDSVSEGVTEIKNAEVVDLGSDQSPLTLASIDKETQSGTREIVLDAIENEVGSETILENTEESENSDESIGTTAISDSKDELTADPSDYSVFKNKTIEIQAAETLGHYAEWLQLRASQLRRINSMRYGTPVVVGKRLKLDFSRVTAEQFEQERVAYHRTLQGEFFEQFQINGTEKYKLRRGQSIWILANRKYKIPIWLLRQYNPDLDFNKVQRGTVITFPKIEVRSTLEATG